jgi:hypothetical protein
MRSKKLRFQVELEPGQVRIWNNMLLMNPCFFLVLGQLGESSMWSVLCLDEVQQWPRDWITHFSDVVDETG